MAAPTESKNKVQYGPPLKPHKKLAVVLSVALGLWIVALWVMYLSTVYTHEKATQFEKDDITHPPTTRLIS